MSVAGKFSAAAFAVVMLLARPCAAGPITAKSWDGPAGTLADLSGQTDFMFGRPTFSAGVYSVTWLGGMTAWRDVTTIGAGGQVLFDAGIVIPGATRTITMTDEWTLWATTPDLTHADSTGDQWAFASVVADTWIWGLEDMLVGRCDCDYQDAYGTLTRIGDLAPPFGAVNPPLGAVSPPLGASSFPPEPLTDPLSPADVGDAAIAVVPEPATIGFIALGLAALAARRKRKRARPVMAEPFSNEDC
jgi:hypothetical protein